MSEQKPHEILTEAGEKPEGVLITFTDKSSMLRYRARCYAVRRRAMESNMKSAFDAGCEPEITGWEDLVFISRGNQLTLWIGVPTKETFGIVSIE